MKRIFVYTLFSSAVLALIINASTVIAQENSIIAKLNMELARATSPVEKSNLNMYKARNYAKLGEYEKALECYDKALKLNHKGWIHLERARFFFTHKEYDLAESEALTAQEETPTLKYQAAPIIKKARKKLESIYLAENPPTIIFDTKADATRKSRFDYIKPDNTNVAVSEYSKQLSKSRAEARKASSKASVKRRVRRT